jgi:hypothetical protein
MFACFGQQVQFEPEILQQQAENADIKRDFECSVYTLNMKNGQPAACEQNN